MSFIRKFQLFRLRAVSQNQHSRSAFGVVKLSHTPQDFQKVPCRGRSIPNLTGETSEWPLLVAARNTHATDMGGRGVHLTLRPAP